MFREPWLSGLPAAPGFFVSTGGPPSALRLVIKLQNHDLSAQSVAMNAQVLGCFGQVAVILLQDFADKPLFKLTDGILKKEAIFD